MVTALILGLACNDQSFHDGEATPTGGGDPVDTGTASPPTETGTPPPEDSGTDTGTAPPPECPEADTSPGAVAIDSTCVGPAGGTFDLEVEWSSLDNLPTLGEPVVGHLTDDDGDGVIGGPGDVPDLVVYTLYNDVVALSGDGTGTLWVQDTIGGMLFNAHPALGDIDGDGAPEIIVQGMTLDGTGMYTLEALDGQTGEIRWSAPMSGIVPNQASISIADLDADGEPEVTMGNHIFDGATGDLRGVGALGTGALSCESGYTMDRTLYSVPVDLDLDGDLELVTGNTVYDEDAVTVASNAMLDGAVAFANFDDDPEPEILVVSDFVFCSATIGYQIRLQEADMSLTWKHESGFGAQAYLPTIADFDGDGAPEIAILHTEEYGGLDPQLTVFEGDGSIAWSHPLEDLGLALGALVPSAIDIDRDGAYEIVLRTADSIALIDGTTGAVLTEYEGLGATAGVVAPIVVDVDGDDQAEIVTTVYDYMSISTSGLVVLGGANGDWPDVREVWNQHAYSITNVDDDLGIPGTAIPSWPTYNSFRAADTDAPKTVDAIPALGDVCVERCAEGLLEVVVRIANGGTETMPAGVPYRVEGSSVGVWTELAWGVTVSDVAPGETTAGVELTVDAALAADGMRVIVDDDPYLKVLPECHTDNNIVEIAGPFCP